MSAPKFLRNRVFVTGVTRTPRREPPTRHGDEPIRAWKNAYWFENEFHAIAAGATYGVDERAHCIAHVNALGRPSAEHHAPVLECACGFYAFKTPALTQHELSVWLPSDNIFGVDQTTLTVLLEVNLSGRIIAHERGYRAERQQIITVYASPDAFTKTTLPAHIEEALHIPVRSVEHLRLPERSP